MLKTCTVLHGQPLFFNLSPIEGSSGRLSHDLKGLGLRQSSLVKYPVATVHEPGVLTPLFNAVTSSVPLLPISGEGCQWKTERGITQGQPCSHIQNPPKSLDLRDFVMKYLSPANSRKGKGGRNVHRRECFQMLNQRCKRPKTSIIGLKQLQL